ncbi:hypothetical protein JCM5353_005810 [Sporobolomyces roseus]
MSATPSSLSSRPQELTPQQLATSWKKTGQFDKLRKQFLQDFLNSSDKETLMKELDAILPSLISDAVPPLDRIPRKDRPTHLMTALDKSNTLSPNLDKVKTRLSRKGEKGSRGIGRTIERELRGCIRNSRGNKGEEEMADSQEEEEIEEVTKKEEEDVKMEEKEEESVANGITPSDAVPQPDVSASGDPSPLPIPSLIESSAPPALVEPISQPPPPAATDPAPTMPTSIPDPALQTTQPNGTESELSKDIEMTPVSVPTEIKLEDILNIEHL